jgi:regulator of protease activity HflC (stomatin/prohibitin superfamily)
MPRFNTINVTPPQLQIDRRKILLYVVIPLIVIIGLLTGIRQVGTGQIGVVTRYGRVTGRELPEGLHLVVPFGVDRVSRYDVKVLKQEDQANAASRDLQDVSSTIALNYHLEAGKVMEIHRSIGPLYRQKLIDPAMQEVFKATSAKFSAGELITSRAEVKNEALKLIKERLEKYGIIVDDLSIVNFQFSNAFSKAIEEKQVAQQNAERARFNLEASRVDAEAQQAQSQTLSPLFLQKQAIDKWDGKLPQYLGDGTVFNIPLR